ncbi:histidine phosphatase family protein [Ruegeria meonggei]|uniref:Glucosyl-3-phosphoglycerate phosphatase n=1 Tax=Ruegeria meonggei TaxID=1446476 RepID=A0A1X6YWK6_9RHOB|nr:histidine phosphatase family protein [Ruegeria meonggei]SLN33706.1 Glucosyl-3-phosphoglycerate phosphatase [Ruegeria meonggei]
MRSLPTLWFLRHGQTEWNRDYRLQGQLDSPLTEQGIAEARRQALIMPKILAGKPAIFASPLGRARQTADIALAGADYTTDPRLMEIDAGRWQGRYRADIMAEHIEWQANGPTALDIYEAAEGGEGIVAFHDRICSFVKDLTGPTVIVAHGLLGQVLRAHVRGIELAQAGQLSNLQGIVYLLENGQETVLEVEE